MKLILIFFLIYSLLVYLNIFMYGGLTRLFKLHLFYF